MKKSAFIDVFWIFPVTIAQFGALFHCQFDECLSLLKRTSVCVPVETEKIEPSLELFPWEAVVCPDESRQITMNLIDRFHGIFIIRDSFCLRYCVNLFFKAKAFNQWLVRIVSVMDDHRSASDDAAICLQRLSGAWLSHAAKIQHTSLSVCRRAYAELISRQSTEQPAVFDGGFRLPSGEVCLVDPHLSGKDYVWLDVVDHKKDLGKPVKPRSYRISIVKGGCSDGVELEKVHKELYPFRERNLPRVKDGSGKRIELPAACLAFPDCKAGLLVEPVSSDFLRSTERAFLDDDGIYEIHFFLRWLPMFGIIPFRDGRDHQVSRHKGIGKFAPEDFFLSFVHVWRFRPLASVFPKPPSLKKENASQKALSIELLHSLVWR